MKIVSPILCAALIVITALTAPLTLRAQDGDESTRDLSARDPGAVVIEVISVGAVLASARYAVQQNAVARTRNEFRTRTLVNGSGSSALNSLTNRVGTQAPPTLSATVLRDTIPGDIIHLEYVTSTPEALNLALRDLEEAQDAWTVRVESLEVRQSALSAEVDETRRLLAELPRTEELSRMRAHTMVNLEKLETELKSVEKILADADKRMHNARGQFQAARLNAGAAARSGSATGRYYIVRDILVDERAEAKLTTFFHTHLSGRSAAAASQNIPHIRITRVQGPDAKLVAGSIGRMKGGFIALGIGAAVFVEELTVGAIAGNLSKLSREHFAPAIRTAPAQPPY